MKKVFLGVIIITLLLSPVKAGEYLYVYKPTTPDTAFSVIALYKVGEYARALEGCEWLMQIKTPFDSWGYAYGEKHEPKYTAMAMMALMRCENLARGRYYLTITNAAYWLIYTQKSDGSWDSYFDTALSYIALKEYLGLPSQGYIDIREQVKEAVRRAREWLLSNTPHTDIEKIFGLMALEDRKSLEKLGINEELEVYKAFALSYLGESVNLPVRDYNSPMEVAMALYATGKEKYKEKLLALQNFGFWGVLRYRVLDLIDVSKINEFRNLTSVACPYLKKVTPQFEWEKVVLADYYLHCGVSPELPSNITGLLPWQIAEVARIKAYLGLDYSNEIKYLLSIQENGKWEDFFNTEYVILVFKMLDVPYNYTSSIEYLKANLTWMVSAKDESGAPIYYKIPTYYFAYALILFKEFNMSEEFNITLKILQERQYKTGAFPYTQGSVAGITSTSKVLWALEKVGLVDSEMYRNGVSYLRKLLFADIPEPRLVDGKVFLENSTLILIRDSKYIGNATNSAVVSTLDGYIVIYPSQYPLSIKAYEVHGFRAEKGSALWTVLSIVLVVGGGMIVIIFKKVKIKR
ncbi:hypothetical protein PFDSM3638_08450 [Pyrococcus furiosus DSM 3638]|uniref:Squalene cyclase C-terminal domain-containing protein n=3 Tax=Pyrococcus furiosus TaxID=2261 RepID=Q8U0D0_PYRFU|nr:MULTISPECIES: membrane protein [Pyrococcus]AAL81793.1 hypothetical protein PF1669 [Pyrococcus furiosus DSM 3638]AFN04971.1 hypothetical protein PFC_10260 [Pyrococcus furiosus COM1]MDK2870568.1 hypothetical protein [Pyrococcus sp.]QEK79290.1 hypothetical protein PFDSM3638_08450 [Pyrococcus furiosus DSM 3638]